MMIMMIVDNLRTRLSRLVQNKRLQQLLRETDKVVSRIETSNLTETSSLCIQLQLWSLRHWVITSVSAYNNCLPPWEYRLTVINYKDSMFAG